MKHLKKYEEINQIKTGKTPEVQYNIEKLDSLKKKSLMNYLKDSLLDYSLSGNILIISPDLLSIKWRGILKPYMGKSNEKFTDVYLEHTKDCRGYGKGFDEQCICTHCKRFNPELKEKPLVDFIGWGDSPDQCKYFMRK